MSTKSWQRNAHATGSSFFSQNPWIPSLVLAPVAGVLVDRWNRHRLLLLTQTLAMLQAFALAALALTVAGTAGVAFSAAWVDPSIGLGPVNLLLAVVLVPLLVFAVGPGSRGGVRFLWPVVAVVCTALYVPALWQPMH